MNFARVNAHTTPLFKNCNILKFANIINVESYIFINNGFNKDSFTIFNENFKLVSTADSYNARNSFNHFDMELSSRKLNWILFFV